VREGSGNKLILILSLLSVVFLVTSISSCREASKQKKLVNQERLRRMELEEEILSLSGRNSELELKVNQLEKNLNQQETACRESQRELNQQVVELERELKRVTELKEELEKDLGEAQGGAR